MIPRSRFRHSSLTFEACRLVVVLVVGLLLVGVVAAVALAAAVGVILWGVIVLGQAGWRRWHA